MVAMLRRLISNFNPGQSANRSLTLAARKRWLTFRKCYRAATVRESVPSPIFQSFSRSRFGNTLGIALGIALVASAPVRAATPSFTVGWSVYVGWNPYYYMAKSGILRKWGAKYGIDIRVQRFDYAPSLDAFVAKNID